MKVKIENNIAYFESKCLDSSQWIDYGKNKKNIQKIIDAFNEIKNSHSDVVLLQKYKVLEQNFGKEIVTENTSKLKQSSTLRNVLVIVVSLLALIILILSILKALKYLIFGN